MLMEEIYQDWEEGTTLPQFKAEYPIHLNGVESLAGAAQATATRLNLTARDEERFSAPIQRLYPGVGRRRGQASATRSPKHLRN